jgi:L-ascorbate metabolism protein UlaG (beta-lactamase superfamily)
MKLAITWLGHASFKIRNEQGTAVYIDPWITDNPSCTTKLEEINDANIVCVTHGHFDHFGDSLAIVKRTGAKLVCSPDIGWYAHGKGVEREKESVTMDIGGSVQLENITISMVQAIHTCELYGEEWISEKKILPGGGSCGFVFNFFDSGSSSNVSVYYAGDTDVFTDMKTIAELYEPHISILPIGDKYTMGIRGAALAASWLRSKVVIPMHFGTFPALEQDPNHYVRLVKEKAPDIKVIVLNPGQLYTWSEA